MGRIRSIFPVLTLLSTIAGCTDDSIATDTEVSSSSGSGSSGSSSTQDSSGAITSSTSSTATGPTSSGTMSETGTTDAPTGTSTTSTTGTTTATDTGTTTGTGSSTGGVECMPGQVNCDCDADSCEGSAICALGKCLPAGDGSCFSEFDFVCDEPGACAPGTDPFDCCASPQNAVCEEFDFGGECAPYSDFFDCGYCPFVADGECDNGLCPPGTDEVDCCATPQNGVCEEMSQGGLCPDGSDTYDCGGCAFENDGECDVPEFCPDGTDQADCCATPQNGVCEEMSQGGLCPDGSDPYDCGVCIYEDDGVCDVPEFCPDGTDLNDCCATPQNGVCEEMQAGGLCPDGTDPYDCGVCPTEGDFICDVPDSCPDGTDVEDCCATPKNGVCEEMQAGGLCFDGSDPYDCGVCLFEDDFVCDVPDFCPEGTDINDCCATPQNGVCEELSQGGQCPDGTDQYDCGFCPYEDDFECDVPAFCPEGSDLNDCA